MDGHASLELAAVAPPPSPARDRLYFDARTWREILHLAATRAETARYAKYFVASQAIFGAVRAVVAGGRALDDVLYPAWRDVKVEKPFFIFANARSGTTLLHRLMSLDEERFTYSRLYETLFHAVCVHRLVERSASVDARWLDGRLARIVDAVDARVFRVWKDIHPMGLGQAEEDEAYFIFSLLTPGLYPFYPYPAELERLSWLDRMPADVRARVMDDYEGAVKRLLFAQGRGRRLLSKSVFLQGRLDSFRERFPDASFVYLVRHPYESIPSFVSMFSAVWRLHSPEIPSDSAQTRAIAKIAIDFYRRGLEAQRELPAEQMLTVRYDTLVADPAATVRAIYAHFDMAPSAAFEARLAAATAKARTFRSRHGYSLELYGLTKDDVYRPLREAFERFGFER